MNILICSHAFHPSIGGIETVSRLLAEEFTRAGAKVTVVTETVGTGRYSYDVRRNPTKLELIRCGRQADVILQSNISLSTLLPLMSLKKPVVITHHTWLTRANGELGWQDRLKRLVLPLCHNVAISKSIAEKLPVRAAILTNPFEKDSFYPFRFSQKQKDIVFLGRLVSDKGCDLLIEALSLLRQEGLRPMVSIVGDGPERKSLETLVAERELSAQVTFLGLVTGNRGQEISRHKVMVIPSRWNEPFGLVALEGIAAGCAIVASSQGGLAEAVGPCGALFPNGDVPKLADSLRKVLEDDKFLEDLLVNRETHLEQFDPGKVARDYLELFKSLCSG